MGDRRENKDRILAGALTLLCVLLILLGLFYGSVRWDRAMLAEVSTPEIMEDEPIFIEPYLTTFGEEDADAYEAPTESMQGDPIPAEVPQPRVDNTGTVKKTTPTPAPPVKSEKPEVSPELKNSEKERKAAADAVASVFGSGSGSAKNASEGASGAGGTGTLGISGTAHGRTFLNCPLPDVKLRHKTIVTVNVVIDAAGNVTEAKASGSADASIRRKCEEAARKAKWSAKKGASDTRGSITFTITPH